MSLYIDASARREAMAIRQGEIDAPDIRIGQLAGSLACNEEASPNYINGRAASLKARAFGHMGIVVADTVELVLAEQSQYGPFGLLRKEPGGAIREANEGDIATRSGVTTCWEDTLVVASERVLEAATSPNADRQKAANIETLEGHWALRRRAFGLSYGLDGLMAGGCATAAIQSSIMTYGMIEYYKSQQANTQELTSVLRRSFNPLASVAELEVAQLDAFNIRYGGKRDDPRYDLNRYYYEKLDHSIYTKSRRGTIVIEGAIEDLPVKRHGTVGHVPPKISGPRIGCPILLTPQLLQRLWDAHTGSLVVAGHLR